MIMDAAYKPIDQQVEQMLYSRQPGMYLVRYARLCRRITRMAKPSPGLIRFPRTDHVHLHLHGAVVFADAPVIDA